MDVVETSESDLERRFAVTIHATDVDARVERRLQDLAASLRLPGFRPGKVPLAVARERYGAAAAEEITRAIARESAEQLLRERGLQPAVPPIVEVTPRAAGEDLRCTVKVELMPEIPEIDPATIDLERPVVEDPGDVPEKRLRELARDWMKRQLLDRLAEMCSFPVPPAILQRELAAIERAVAAELRRETGTPEASAAGPDAGALRMLAERRVRLGLLLAAIGRRHQIEAVGAALEEQVVDLFLARARITERPMSVQDLVANVED
jgi:FKBP-type peptidyl-prolyl cis-trans isomerase (trigger factor)